MNFTVRDTLFGLGIPKNRIYFEHFGATFDEKPNTIKAVTAEMTASLNGKTYKTQVPEGKTILDSLKNTTTDVPYSCESGVCGTCVAKLVKGKVEMKSCMALDDEEVSKGLILTCQAFPTSESLEVEF